MQVSQPLIHEQQLGNKLNVCIVEHRRADFALMLSMLTNDVREISAFQFERRATQDQSEIDWRSFFNLPKAQALGLDSVNQVGRYNQASLILEQRDSDLRLQNVLQVNPLAFRDDKSYIPLQVKANLDSHTLRKLEDKTESEPSAQIGFSAKKWLNNLQQSIVNNQISLKDTVHSIA